MDWFKDIFMTIISELAFPASSPGIDIHFSIITGKLDKRSRVVGAACNSDHVLEL